MPTFDKADNSAFVKSNLGARNMRSGSGLVYQFSFTQISDLITPYAVSNLSPNGVIPGVNTCYGRDVALANASKIELMMIFNGSFTNDAEMQLFISDVQSLLTVFTNLRRVYWSMTGLSLTRNTSLPIPHRVAYALEQLTGLVPIISSIPGLFLQGNASADPPTDPQAEYLTSFASNIVARNPPLTGNAFSFSSGTPVVRNTNIANPPNVRTTVVQSGLWLVGGALSPSGPFVDPIYWDWTDVDHWYRNIFQV